MGVFGHIKKQTISFDAGSQIYIALFYGTACITLFLYVRSHYPKAITARYKLREWVRSSASMCGSSLVGALLSRLDILMLGLFVAASELAEYGVAARIAVLLSFLYSALNNALIPTISKNVQENTLDSLNSLIPKIMRIACAVTLLGFGMTVMLGEWLLSLFGEEYISAYIILLVLAAAQSINLYAGPLGSVLLVTGHQKALLYFTLFFAALLAGALWFSIASYGLLGAAIATFCVVVLLNASLLILVKRLTSIRLL